MPPLFKAGTWDSSPAATNQLDQFKNNEPSSNVHQELLPVDTATNQFNPLTFHNQNPNLPQSAGDYVDVLPPGAETVSGPEHLPNHPDGNPGSPSEHETASAVLDPVVDVLQHHAPGATEPHSTTVNQPTDLGTKVSSDGQHVIHIQQSPVIDLSQDDSESKDSNDSGVTEQAPVILQNADGSYGINASWVSDDSKEVSSTVQVADGVDSRENMETTVRPRLAKENVTSLLLHALRNAGRHPEFGRRIITTTQEPYGSRGYQGVVPLEERERLQNTTEEPFLEALMKSYHDFEKEEQEQEERESWVDPIEIHVGAGFSQSSGTARRLKDEGYQQQGGKRNKQVSLGIPILMEFR